MPCPKQAQLITIHSQDLQTKVVQSKGWLSVGVWLGSMIYGKGLWTSARCVVQSLVAVRMVIELRYRNTPQIHITNIPQTMFWKTNDEENTYKKLHQGQLIPLYWQKQFHNICLPGCHSHQYLLPGHTNYCFNVFDLVPSRLITIYLSQGKHSKFWVILGL